jgi:hypothetical protein
VAPELEPEKLQLCLSREATGYGTPEFWDVMRCFNRVMLELQIFTEEELKSSVPTRITDEIYGSSLFRVGGVVSEHRAGLPANTASG